MSNPNEMREFSCYACRQRKVKCDRREPCANCVRADAACEYVQPTRGKRTRAKPPRESLHAKIARYERILEKHGEGLTPSLDHDGQSSVAESVIATPATHIETAVRRQHASAPNPPSQVQAISTEPSSRYFDSTLWSNIGKDFNHPDDCGPDEPLDAAATSDDDGWSFFGGFTVGSRRASQRDLRSFYPDESLFIQLKLVYAEHVEPLIKMLHFASLSETLGAAVANPLSSGPPVESALFAFCLAATSVTSEDRCQGIFSRPRPEVIKHFGKLTMQAFSKGQFLQKPDLLSLQAFSLYLLGVKSLNDYGTYHILCGMAVRLCMRAGLHRDGTSIGMPPFETELRRRLWWHMVQLDFRTSDLLGLRPSLDLYIGDTKPPANIEDCDIWPDMPHPPEERKGITSLVIFRVRCDIMHFLRHLTSPSSNDLGWEVLSNPQVPTHDKDRMIRDLEDLLESKYLRYCDPCEELHTFTSIIIRSVLCRMKVLAHNPRHFAQRNVQLPESERDIIFVNAVKLLEYAAMIRNNPVFHKFMWRTSATYMWDTILYVLIAARHRKAGPEIERIWHLIGVLISAYPDAFGHSAAAVHSALSKWIPEVWSEYAAAATAQGLSRPVPPQYIADMLDARAARQQEQQQAVQAAGAPEGDITGKDDFAQEDFFQFSDLDAFAMDPNEWTQWEQLLSREDPFGAKFSQI